jgi:hypothetical protein
MQTPFSKSNVIFKAKDAVVPKAAIKRMPEDQFAQRGITIHVAMFSRNQSDSGKGTVTVTGSLPTG